MAWEEAAMTTRRSALGAGRRLLAASLPLLLALGLALAVPAFSAGVAAEAIEPSSIALNPEDLPPGYTIDETRTMDRPVGNIGPGHFRALNREFTTENLASGPVWIVQSVVRLDSGIGAGDALRSQRDYWQTTGEYTPTEDGPNDDGTMSLVKEGDASISYLVGFIKENMIIITIVGGAHEVTTYAYAVEYAGISSAKLDAALGR